MFLPDIIDANIPAKSGAPFPLFYFYWLPNERKVTPATSSDKCNISQILSNVGEKFLSAKSVNK
jgi:inner membrane protein involved in colicin E2 resistance